MFGYGDKNGADKRSFALDLAAAFVLCAVLLASCAGPDGGSLLDYQTGLTGASVKWEHEGNAYEGTVAFEGDQPEDPGECRQAVVTLSAPEEIAGLTVRYSADGAEASVGSVSFALPENTGEELYRIVRSLSLYSGEMKGAGSGSSGVRFEAEVCGDATGFDITYADGYPRSAAITWGDGETLNVEYTGLVRE